MNNPIEQLQNKLDEILLKNDIENEKLLQVQYKIDNFEPDLHDQYDEMLDEIYQDEIDQVSFISLPSASELLKEHDPVDYRCGYNDYVDSFDFESLEEYQELQEDLEEIENTISEIEEEIEEIQEQIEALEEDEE